MLCSAEMMSSGFEDYGLLVRVDSIDVLIVFPSFCKVSKLCNEVIN